MNLVNDKRRGVRKNKIDPNAKEQIIARAKSVFTNPKPTNPQVNQLLEAIKRIEKIKTNESKNGTTVSLLDHAVERAFKSDTVLINVLKKLIPDLKRTESDVNINGGIDVSYMSEEELKNATREFFEKLSDTNS